MAKSIDEHFADLGKLGLVGEETSYGISYAIDPRIGVGRYQLIGDLSRCYVVLCDSTFLKDMVTTEATDERYITVTASISGETMYYTKRDEPHYHDPGLNIFVNHPLITGYTRIKAHKRIVCYGFIFREAFFEGLPFELPSDFWERSAQALNEGLVYHPLIFQMCEQIKDISLTGLEAKLFVYGRCIEVLSLLLDLVYNDEAVVYPALTPADREAVEEAQRILLHDLKNPPTVSELAKMVGLNQQKLMKRFKQTTSTTVYGFITRQRMYRAAELLRETDMKVLAIAREVGYAGDGHFQKAFFNTYGTTPSSFRKER